MHDGNAIFLHRSILHDPARLTVKTFVGRYFDYHDADPFEWFSGRFASSIVLGLSDDDLLMLSLVYWHFDASAQGPSSAARQRLLETLFDYSELYDMCAILCDLYNARAAEQMTVIFFMAELCGLLSYIALLF
ncbi:hypothetical protein BJX66DRAFT_301716 [Aspergillus keveii]|uniref:Uncharacterized protein n=1 Tax=Aspergillus keveii TaxID=714993 RepID=A0ABR4G904_9EURO